MNGPLVADTVFIKEYKNYDLLVGMYHDQILSPFKALFRFDAINVTLGLIFKSFARSWYSCQPNWQKKANPTSLIKCIIF